MEEVEEYQHIDDIKAEIKPILPFCRPFIDHTQEYARIGLSPEISFKAFSQYFPDITREQLIKLFDWCDDSPRHLYIALQELEQEAKQGHDCEV